MDNEVKTQKKAEYFVNAILNGKNLKASKYLEKIIKSKCENKIKETLKQ